MLHMFHGMELFSTLRSAVAVNFTQLIFENENKNETECNPCPLSVRPFPFRGHGIATTPRIRSDRSGPNRSRTKRPFHRSQSSRGGSNGTDRGRGYRFLASLSGVPIRHG